MPLIYALKTDMQPMANVADGMFSVWTFPPGDPKGDSATRIPMSRPAGGVLAQFGAAWQGASLDFAGTMEVLLNGAPTGKLVPMSGASGFGLPFLDPVVAWPYGGHASFRFARTAGTIPTTFQTSCVVRPAAGQATHAQISASVYPTKVVLQGLPIGFDHFEVVAAGWNALAVGLVPMLTGVLVPVPASLTRVVGELTSNTMDIPVALRIWDALAGVQIGAAAMLNFLPAAFGVQDSGPIIVPVGGLKVLSVRGDMLPGGTGQVIAPVRITYRLDIA